MMNKETDSPPTNTEKDDLKTINGIKDTYAEALNNCDIFTFDQLSQVESEKLAQQMKEKGVRQISVSQINKWKEQIVPKYKGSQIVQDEKKESNLGNYNWYEHAVYAVHFESAVDKTGKQLWQTHVYYDKSLEEDIEFDGVEPKVWANWIMNHAQLPMEIKPDTFPADKKEMSVTDRSVQTTAQATQSTNAKINNLHMTVAVGNSSLSPEKNQLVAQVQFELTGENAEKLVNSNTPYHIDLLTKNLETGDVNFIESELSKLESGKLKYSKTLTFPVPEVGRYTIQCVVLLMPPTKMAAWYTGPTINVIP